MRNVDVTEGPGAGGEGAQARPSPFLLLQLADSFLPTGGFAYSSGLEAMARLGRFRDLEDFREYMEGYLAQAAGAELPWLNAFYVAGGGDWDAEVPELLAEWGAFLTLPEARLASLAQGEAWTRLAGSWPLAPARRVAEWFAAGPRSIRPPHGLAAFALLARALGLGRRETQRLHLHAGLRDQLGAALRLGLVGPTAAQALLFGLGERAEAERRRAWRAGPGDAHRGAPLLELAQAHHSRLYSRMFRN